MQRENLSRLSAQRQTAITALLAALSVTEAALASSQFPSTLTDVDGPITKPASY